MRYCADTSVVLGLYINLEKSQTVERFLAEDAKVISISDLGRLEVLNVLLRNTELNAAEKFEADLGEGLRIRLESVDWEDVFVQAESLARRFSHVLRPGGHDLVLVAAAVSMGAMWFLSFDRDSNQRPLAAAAGLRVGPPLDKDEKGLAKRASRVK
jgi:predicted nucleic acid-binding protein